MDRKPEKLENFYDEDTNTYVCELDEPVTFPVGVMRIIIRKQYNQTTDFPEGVDVLIIENNAEFNQYIKLPSSLKELTLGGRYNRKVTLTPNLVSVTTGDSYNQPLNFMTCTQLDSIILGRGYNHPLHLSHLRKLTYVDIGAAFNHPLVIPEGVIELNLGSSMNDTLTLPVSLVYLRLGENFNLRIDFARLVNLLELELGRKYNQFISQLPPKLKVFVSGWDFNQRIAFPPSVQEITFGESFNKPIQYPAGLRSLRFGNNYTLAINVGNLDKLHTLQTGNKFSNSLVLPTNLKHLILGERFNSRLSLKKLTKLETLKVGNAFNYPLDGELNPSLRVLHLGRRYQRNFSVMHLTNLEDLDVRGFHKDVKNFNVPNSVRILKHPCCGINISWDKINNNAMKYYKFFNQFNKSVERVLHVEAHPWDTLDEALQERIERDLLKGRIA